MFSTSGGRKWADANGGRSPVVLHHGESISIWVRDRRRAESILKRSVEVGMPAHRPWATLNVVNRYDSYWNNRDVGPVHTPNYRSEMRDYVQMCGEVGSRIRLSFGDLKGLSDQGETELFEMWAEIVAEFPDAFLMVEGLNEARDTGDADDRSPAEIERLVNIIRRRVPHLVYELSAFTGHEDTDTFKAWTPSWQKHLLLHDSRAGHISDKCRHAWNAGYEANKVRSDLVLVNHGEPAGYGDWVSASDNKHELGDPDAVHLYLASMKVGRGIPTFFCSAGVKADDSFDDYPGFSTVADVLNRIPDEVSGWTLVHGGDRVGSQRVFAVPPGGDPLTRADHAINESTGEFAAVLHSPDRRSWRDCRTVRGHDVLDTIPCGEWGKVVIGRII